MFSNRYTLDQIAERHVFGGLNFVTGIPKLAIFVETACLSSVEHPRATVYLVDVAQDEQLRKSGHSCFGD